MLLVSRGPIEEVRRVALDQNSRTSVALVRILLQERWGVHPEYVHERPDPERMLSIVGNDELAPVATQVRDKLIAVVARATAP